jgi:hypothetical protein
VGWAGLLWGVGFGGRGGQGPERRFGRRVGAAGGVGWSSMAGRSWLLGAERGDRLVGRLEAVQVAEAGGEAQRDLPCGAGDPAGARSCAYPPASCTPTRSPPPTTPRTRSDPRHRADPRTTSRPASRGSPTPRTDIDSHQPGPNQPPDRNPHHQTHAPTHPAARHPPKQSHSGVTH